MAQAGLAVHAKLPKIEIAGSSLTILCEKVIENIKCIGFF